MTNKEIFDVAMSRTENVVQNGDLVLCDGNLIAVYRGERDIECILNSVKIQPEYIELIRTERANGRFCILACGPSRELCFAEITMPQRN